MRRIALLLAGLLLVAPGCAEATAEINAPDAWQSKSADPAFMRRAESALAKAPPADAGWRVGVILAEQNEDGSSWKSSVLTPDGIVMIGPDPWSYDCEAEGDGIAVDTFPLLLDPGDLITWAGDGRLVHAVCAEDMRVIRKAVA